MRSEIKRWGNSAAVRLPKAVLHRAGLTIDAAIDVEVDDGVIMIKRPHDDYDQAALTEAELLDGLDAYTAHADELAVILPSELGD